MFDDECGPDGPTQDDGSTVAPGRLLPGRTLPGRSAESGHPAESGRAGSSFTPDAVAGQVDPGPRPSVHDVSSAIDDVVEIQAQIDALEGRKLLAVERARRAAHACEAALLDGTDPELRRATARRRRELAQRAFTADLASALHVSETRAAHVCDTAQTLVEATIAAAGPVASDGADGSPTSTLVELCRGRLSAAHAAAVADVLADLPDAEARARVEASVLPAAAHATVGQLRRRLRRARDLAHPVPLATRHRDAATRRAVFVDPAADGMAWLTALLPAPSAHAVHDRLTRAARAAKSADDGRTLDQLRADALTGLLLADAGGATGHVPGNGSGGGPGGSDDSDSDDDGSDDAHPADDGSEHTSRPAPAPDPVPVPVPDLVHLARRITPTVRVTVPVTAMLGGMASADLDGHGPLDADTAARLTANARSLRRLLVDPVDGRVLATDPGTYTIPAALRALLEARDGTCRFPGCTVAAARCDLDHVRAWADGGRTTADNLAHVCRRHHVIKHQTTWQATLAGDGTLTWRSPTGRVHQDLPAEHLQPPCMGPPRTEVHDPAHHDPEHRDAEHHDPDGPDTGSPGARAPS